MYVIGAKVEIRESSQSNHRSKSWTQRISVQFPWKAENQSCKHHKPCSLSCRKIQIFLISSPPKQKKCTSVPFQDESFRGKTCQGATMSNITKNGVYIYIYTLDVRRPSIQWWLFQKDDDFRIYNQQFHGTMILIYSNGLWLTGYKYRFAGLSFLVSKLTLAQLLPGSRGNPLLFSSIHSTARRGRRSC